MIPGKGFAGLGNLNGFGHHSGSGALHILGLGFSYGLSSRGHGFGLNLRHFWFQTLYESRKRLHFALSFIYGKLGGVSLGQDVFQKTGEDLAGSHLGKGANACAVNVFNALDELNRRDNLVDEKALHGGLIAGIRHAGDVGDHLAKTLGIERDSLNETGQFVGCTLQNRGMERPGQRQLAEHGTLFGQELAEAVDGPFKAGDCRLLVAVLVGDVNVANGRLFNKVCGLFSVFEENKNTTRGVSVGLLHQFGAFHYQTEGVIERENSTCVECGVLSNAVSDVVIGGETSLLQKSEHRCGGKEDRRLGEVGGVDSGVVV